MKKSDTIGGIDFKIGREIGGGGQGTAYVASLVKDKSKKLLLKFIAHSKKMEQRTKTIVDLNLPDISPFIAGHFSGNTRARQSCMWSRWLMESLWTRLLPVLLPEIWS